MQIFDLREGGVELIGDKIDLKVDTNRKLYVRDKRKGVLANGYKFTGSYIDMGLSASEKKEELSSIYYCTVDNIPEITDKEDEDNDDD